MGEYFEVDLNQLVQISTKFISTNRNMEGNIAEHFILTVKVYFDTYYELLEISHISGTILCHN